MAGYSEVAPGKLAQWLSGGTGSTGFFYINWNKTSLLIKGHGI